MRTLFYYARKTKKLFVYRDAEFFNIGTCLKKIIELISHFPWPHSDIKYGKSMA